MTVEDRIRLDVFDAVSYIAFNESLTDTNDEPSPLSQYKEADDLETISGVFEEPLEPERNIVIVDTLEELEIALSMLGRFFSDLDRNTIEQKLIHEQRHAEASEPMELRRKCFGLILDTNEKDLYTHYAFCYPYGLTRPIIKLEVGALYAAPEIPSDGDVAHINELGYPSVLTLGARILAHNARSSHYISVPNGLTHSEALPLSA